MNRKRTVVIVAVIIFIIALSLLWFKSRQGYNLLCDGDVNMTYSRGSEQDSLHATISLQLLPDYRGDINISGDVAGHSDDFHIFRTAQFHYTLANAAKGVVDITLDKVIFYAPDAEENILSFWTVNKKDVGTSMSLIFNQLDEERVMISNFYSPILICRKN